MSESVYAKQLSPELLQVEDVIWLDKALEKDYHEVTAKDILDGLVEGRFQLWRLGACDGVAVTIIQPYPKGKELYVAYLAGKGYFAHFAEFLSCMEEFAKANHCRWFSGYAQSKGTERLYQQAGKRVGSYYIREVV